jgi:hypothetical protein
MKSSEWCKRALDVDNNSGTFGNNVNYDSYLLFSIFFKKINHILFNFLKFFKILSHKIQFRNSHNKLKLNSNFKKSNIQINLIFLKTWETVSMYSVISLVDWGKFNNIYSCSLYQDHCKRQDNYVYGPWSHAYWQIKQTDYRLGCW